MSLSMKRTLSQLIEQKSPNTKSLLHDSLILTLMQVLVRVLVRDLEVEMGIRRGARTWREICVRESVF